ncbi:MAG: Rieske 2Fe-2S domain-containing protein [Armatimonadetes bacterium]|nr:Rieske 2Fe-2S domain-containing protein [Armatimonadota bacterium]
MVDVTRRRLLQVLAAIPALGAIAAFASPLLRFLKPNLQPYERKDFIGGDAPQGEPVIAARLSELEKPWIFKYFVFVQKYPQYTPEGFKAANVPGVIIRLPRKVRLPWEWAGIRDKESDLIAFSRICPHLGCIFNFVPDWKEITAGYGGYMPPDFRKHALMGCPCHLSIYDPADAAVPGRVISGPAPRPPRTFIYEIKGDDIVIARVEAGGIA